VCDLVRYAQRYGHLLFENGLANLEGVPGSRSALSALANLSKYLGQHTTFKRMREESGISWNRESTEDVFMQIYGERQAVSNVEDWMESLKGVVDWDVWFPVVFMGITGLRTSEAICALNIIAAGGLDEYFNSDLHVLEHFKYRDVFLRRTKKAFISVVSDRLMYELKSWRRPTSYATLRGRVRRRGVICDFYSLRKWYATTLRMNGIEGEYVDFLQGRVGSSVFVRSYLRPDVRQVFEKVRDVLVPFENNWLR